MPRISEELRTIYYEPAGRIQNSEWELINNPPEGYRYALKYGSVGDKLSASSFLFNKVRLKVLDRLVPLNLTKAGFDDLFKKVPKGIDLIHTYNHITSRKIPWVVNVEWAQVLIGRDPSWFKKYKETIEKYLASEWCKGIFTWNTLAMQAMRQAYNTNGFDDKLKVIFPAIRASEFKKDYSIKKPVNILFVGSIDTPEDFYAKGGRETLETFRILHKKYHHDVTFTVRANIPRKFLRAQLENCQLHFIPHILPEKMLNKIFQEADIFVLPSHYAQEMVILKAMNYSLPVVVSRMSTMEEWIINGENGYMLEQPKVFNYIINDFMLTSETTKRLDLVKMAQTYDMSKIVDELVFILKILIDSPKMRKQLGQTAKSATTTGQLSIKHRNNLLKGVYDEA